MLIYFCISPIFLGNLNYKNFSDYENEIEIRFDLLQDKILNDYPFFFIFIKKMIINIFFELKSQIHFIKWLLKLLKIR